jgi:hypothetical protein
MCTCGAAYETSTGVDTVLPWEVLLDSLGPGLRTTKSKQPPPEQPGPKASPPVTSLDQASTSFVQMPSTPNNATGVTAST